MSLNPVSATYLFRVDGAKDNDQFFNALRPSVSNIYAGVDLQLGTRGWVPDFIRIAVGESWQHFCLTIIELEATDSVALISCRKYLPEQPAAIIEACCEYLKRVIKQCHSSADPREAEFEKLRTRLLSAKAVVITTAGALRSSTSFVEELPLINQPRQFGIQAQAIQTDSGVKGRSFRGTVRLSSIENMALGRAILVLDAVIRERDHSGSTVKGWRSSVETLPLRNLLRDSKDAHPFIRSFLDYPQTRGITLDMEPVLSDLVNIWSIPGKAQINPERVRSMIENYYPVAFKIKSHELMQTVFEAARMHLKEMK